MEKISTIKMEMAKEKDEKNKKKKKATKRKS